MNNECPICYETNINCQLRCGHSFCKRCITKWYSESEKNALCPLCRKQIIFKGFSRFKNYILLHKKYTIIQKVFEKYIDIILNQVNIFSMIYLRFVCQQLDKLMTYKQTFSEDEIDILLYFNFPASKELNLHENIKKNLFIRNNNLKRKFDNFKNMFYI